MTHRLVYLDEIKKLYPNNDFNGMSQMPTRDMCHFVKMDKSSSEPFFIDRFIRQESGGRCVVVVESGVRASLLFNQLPHDSAVTIQLMPRSYVEFTFLNELAKELSGNNRLDVHCDEHAIFSGNFLHAGSGEFIQDISLFLKARNAQARLVGAYVLSEGQRYTLKTRQYHQAPHTLSSVVAKGVLSGESSVKFDGSICIDKGAPGANAEQANKNLLLSNSARAQSVPKMEVKNHDVQCAHGSAVSQIDEQLLWYLQSRGTPLCIAQRIIVQGFLSGGDHHSLVVQRALQKVLYQNY